MATLSNRWRTITILLLLWQNYNIAIARPYNRQSDSLTLQKTPSDNYLRLAAGPRGEGSSLKVALFADLHFGESAWTDWGPRQDRNSLKVMSTILDVENPDFVVYLGDVITANNLPIHNASFYWEQAISPTRERNIPWASLFGNHDDAPFEWPMDWFSPSGIPQIKCPSNSSEGGECSFKGTSRLELMRNEIKDNSLSYTGFGPRNLWPSVSNYVLTVVSPKTDQESPLMLMYFLDSGGGSYPEVISNLQSEWFHNKSHELNPDSSIPEIVFWHIPSKAYEKVAKKVVGKHSHCVGSLFKESVAAQEAEMGMMNLLTERPSVKAVFVGHNHGLDWCCPYKKMWLCYARHTGYGGYGNWDRGARILEVSGEPFTLKSWIRMENGTLHSEVVLSR